MKIEGDGCGQLVSVLAFYSDYWLPHLKLHLLLPKNYLKRSNKNKMKIPLKVKLTAIPWRCEAWFVWVHPLGICGPFFCSPWWGWQGTRPRSTHSGCTHAHSPPMSCSIWQHACASWGLSEQTPHSWRHALHECCHRSCCESPMEKHV